MVFLTIFSKFIVNQYKVDKLAGRKNK